MSEELPPNETPDDQATAARVAIQTVTTIAIQSPLPPPAILEHYERILPGAAERILRLAELQAGHRRHLETTVVEADARRATSGQVLGFILALSTIVGGFVLIRVGRSLEGLASVVLAATSLVAVFVATKHAESRERERKRAKLETSGHS